MADGCDIETLERVATACFGERGAWTYRAVRWANEALFGGQLRPPLVQWAITPHGACLGHTQTWTANPVITLHPAIWGDGDDHARAKSEAWGGVHACKLYALDVLVHELVHVRLDGTASGKSSHDNAAWAAEVERVSPLLGLGKILASPTKRARRGGRMVRVPAKHGALPMKAVAGWPHSVRPTEYYEGSGELPDGL